MGGGGGVRIGAWSWIGLGGSSTYGSPRSQHRRCSRRDRIIFIVSVIIVVDNIFHVLCTMDKTVSKGVLLFVSYEL